MHEFIDLVAVSANPVLWNAYCDLCQIYISVESLDVIKVEEEVELHKLWHIK